jgi:hypothetical protein
MHSLVHLTAAGLLPAKGRDLTGFLVDPDEANGNVTECVQAGELYARCKAIKLGNDTSLLANNVSIQGPWTPVADNDEDTLETIFHYDAEKRGDRLEADLMELFFARQERNELQIKEGFRGRPAIGSAVLTHSIDFEKPFWKDLITTALNARAQDKVRLMFGGSVFGGSGAAGVPTICRLLKELLAKQVDKSKLGIGLVLFLPYFTYDKVEDEELQADPNAFATATAEALKYYEKGGFLDICDAIYCLGERYPAQMPRPAIGAAEQRNPAHILELVAALGVLHFWNGQDDDGKGRVTLAARKEDATVSWADLPIIDQDDKQKSRLQQFILFSVFYHYILNPFTKRVLHKQHVITNLLDDVPGDRNERHKAGADLEAMDQYVVSFLHWLMEISTQKRAGVEYMRPGLVNLNVFAADDGAGGLRLKMVEEFKEKQINELFLNLDTKRKPNLGTIWRAVANADREKLPGAVGAGRKIRAVYEACKFQ